jgi:large subunit ribosomal protein L27
MAHKKAGGSTRLGRDSQPKYLGTKVGDGEMVNPGQVLVRQIGTKIHPGKNVKNGRQDTLYSMASGKVKFSQKKRERFDGKIKLTTFVSVLPTVKK